MKVDIGSVVKCIMLWHICKCYHRHHNSNTHFHLQRISILSSFECLLLKGWKTGENHLIAVASKANASTLGSTYKESSETLHHTFGVTLTWKRNTPQIIPSKPKISRSSHQDYQTVLQGKYLAIHQGISLSLARLRLSCNHS